MKRFIIQILLVLVTLFAPMSMFAISGYFSDPGGGSYWCNVYVATVSHGKSYSWCTGIDANSPFSIQPLKSSSDTTMGNPRAMTGMAARSHSM